MDPAVDRSAGRPFPALIVCQPIFWDDPTKFIDGILCHDVHWCHAEAWDQPDAGERYRHAVAILDVLTNELFWHLRLLQRALPKARASSMSFRCSSLLNLANGHMFPSSRKFFIHCQSGWRPKTFSRTFVGRNFLPFPSGEFSCALNALPKSKS